LWVVSVNRKPEKKTYIGARVHPLGFIREIAVNCEALPLMGILGVLPRILGESPPILDVGHMTYGCGEQR